MRHIDEDDIHLISNRQTKDKFQANQTRETELHIYQVDTKLTRKRLASEQVKYRVSRKPRNKSKGFSRQSKRNLLFRIRNDSRLVQFVTVTYPGFYGELSRLDMIKHRAKFIRKLRKMSISGYIITEFHEYRRFPHYHLVIDGFLDQEELFAIWSNSIAYKDTDIWFESRGVHTADIYDQSRLAGYLAKPRGKLHRIDISHWSAFGVCRKIEAPISLKGTAKELAPMYRIAKVIDLSLKRTKAREKGIAYTYKKVTDNGRTGKTLYDVAHSLRSALSIKESINNS